MPAGGRAVQGVFLLRGILVLVVGFFIIHWVFKLLGRNQKYIKIEPTLKGFLDNLIKLVLYIIVILTAANIMGIPMTSVVTLVASAGVAISLALQGALSNLVGGLILLILKPIKVDEFIKVGDIEGCTRDSQPILTDINLPQYTYTPEGDDAGFDSITVFASPYDPRPLAESASGRVRPFRSSEHRDPRGARAPRRGLRICGPR